MIFGIQAPINGLKPDLVTITEKNLSKKTKENAVMTPKAKLKPIPCLLLNDEAETAKIVKTKAGNAALISLPNGEGWLLHSETNTLQIEKSTQSPYSLFYFFRKNNIQDFKNRKISLIQNNKTVLLNLKVRENEVINVPAGEYTCSIVSPERKDNKKFKNKAELDVMFSNDLKKYPVKIRLKLKYGYLVLELDKIIN